MKYVICVNNDDYAASLEVRRLYECLPDEDAAQHGQLRVIDESGEDYLYPPAISSLSIFLRMSRSRSPVLRERPYGVAHARAPITGALSPQTLNSRRSRLRKPSRACSWYVASAIFR